MNAYKFITQLAPTALLLFASNSVNAIPPAFVVEQGSVRLQSVAPENPILYDNDWWFDVFDNNYLWSQASLGKANLRGNIVSRDMWDWEKGYLYTLEKSIDDANRAIHFARLSGLKNIPDATVGADRVLECPPSGEIADTVVYPNEGNHLIIREALNASPEKPLLIFAGGPLTTVANALLIEPRIADNMVVFGLTVAGGYNGNDAWSTYIVAKRARLVDWATGSFWDKNSVFTVTDFEVLPRNPFCDDMRELISTGLGQENQLGDGAALVWLWRNDCWSQVKLRKAVWHGSDVSFDEVESMAEADLIDIPKSATDLQRSREEFFRVLLLPELFPASNRK